MQNSKSWSFLFCSVFVLPMLFVRIDSRKKQEANGTVTSYRGEVAGYIVQTNHLLLKH